ncbi:unnamed protein product [Musa acuminata var. zebrina]
MCRCCRFTACLFCIGLLVSLARYGGGTRVTPPMAAPTVHSSTATSIAHMSWNPFCDSKRSVPHGPDPIHNRYLRAGKSGRPQGRA